MSSSENIKKLRVFAGPNGSGKTTIVNEIRTKYNVGSFVNADIIQQTLNRLGYLDYSEIYHYFISTKEWLGYLKSSEREVSKVLLSLKFSDYHLISSSSLDGYDAAIIAEFFRFKLVFGMVTFSYETVFSHESKLEFLRSAIRNGFKIYLYFVCTQDPRININRVKNRVLQGGHDVGEDKIESRYYRTLGLLKDAFLLSDRAFVIDTTFTDAQVVVEKNGNNVNVLTDEIPEWVEEYLLKYLS